MNVSAQEEPVFRQGRYWTGMDFKAFQRALQRSQRQWTEADRALIDRYLSDLVIRREAD